MSERPWKDSMHIRQENLLVFKLGELTVEGEAGVSLLSWWKITMVRDRIYYRFIFSTKTFSYLHLLKDPIRQSWSEVNFFTFQVLWLRHFNSWRTTSLSITAKTEVLSYDISILKKHIKPYSSFWFESKENIMLPVLRALIVFCVLFHHSIFLTTLIGFNSDLSDLSCVRSSWFIGLL